MRKATQQDSRTHAEMDSYDDASTQLLRLVELPSLQYFTLLGGRGGWSRSQAVERNQIATSLNSIFEGSASKSAAKLLKSFQKQTVH